MSVILSIETASASCSVALSYDDEIIERNELGNNIHSAVLLTMVDELLSSAGLTAQNLDAVAVGQGPGSFTGLRIGVGVGQGLAYGADCPMIGVSSLDALALQAVSQDSAKNSLFAEGSISAEGSIIAMLDARMGEVYWREYKSLGQGIRSVGDVQVSAPSDISSCSPSKPVCVIGNAWQVYSNQFTGLESSDVFDSGVVYPSAESLLVLAEKKYQQGECVSAAEFMPIYVRNDVAKKSTKKLPGRRAL